MVSDELKARVERAVRELRYTPNQIARSLKTRQTKMIGMIISDITNPFFPQLVRGAEDAALRHQYMLVTFNTDDRVELEDQAVAELQARKVDGLLLVMAQSRKDVAPIAAVNAGGTPVVALDRITPGLPVDSVSVTNAKGSRECVRHLIELGHKRIATITGSLSLQIGRDRLQGYKAALREAGIAPDPELILECDFREQQAYELALRLLSKPEKQRPTALFGANCMMTLGVLRALETLGLQCPRDIALATFDDLPLAESFRPHLTSVAQPTYEIGFQGAELLIERLSGKRTAVEPVHLRLETTLRIRESTTGYTRMRAAAAGSRICQ